MVQENLDMSVKIISPAFLLFPRCEVDFRLNISSLTLETTGWISKIFFCPVFKFTDTQLCSIIYFLKNETKAKVLPVSEEAKLLKQQQKKPLQSLESPKKK